MAEPNDELCASHEQTVAALRRSGAIEQELTKLLANANIGRVDMRAEIETAIIALVDSAALTASEVVTEIGVVPEQPVDQLRWLENHFQHAIDSAVAALAQHRAKFAGQGLDPTYANGVGR